MRTTIDDLLERARHTLTRLEPARPGTPPGPGNAIVDTSSADERHEQ